MQDAILLQNDETVEMVKFKTTFELLNWFRNSFRELAEASKKNKYMIAAPDDEELFLSGDSVVKTLYNSEDIKTRYTWRIV